MGNEGEQTQGGSPERDGAVGHGQAYYEVGISEQKFYHPNLNLSGHVWTKQPQLTQATILSLAQLRGGHYLRDITPSPLVFKKPKVNDIT